MGAELPLGQQARNDGIVLDSGELTGVAQHGGKQGKEQTGAHAGFQHAAPAEAQAFGRSPECTNNRSEAYSSGVTAASSFAPISSHSGRNASSPGQRKQFCASSEAPSPINRGNRACSSGVGVPPDCSKNLRQTDRGDVVPRSYRPAASKRALAGEMEVAAACGPTRPHYLMTKNGRRRASSSIWRCGWQEAFLKSRLRCSIAVSTAHWRNASASPPRILGKDCTV